MATFSNNGHIRITIINYCSNSDVAYNFLHLVTQTAIKFDSNINLTGSLSPQQNVECGLSTSDGGTLEIGSVSFVTAKNAPIAMRFWSGSGGQYVNLLKTMDFNITQDTQDLSGVTGNGLKITVDGNGVNNPTTEDIYVKIYDNQVSRRSRSGAG